MGLFKKKSEASGSNKKPKTAEARKLQKTENIPAPELLERLEFKEPARLTAEWVPCAAKADELPVCAAPAQTRDLPSQYGDHHIFVMVRDPYWLFTYWELRCDRSAEILESQGANAEESCPVLRVYDLTEGGAHSDYFDIALSENSHNWYVRVSANRSYAVEVGRLLRDGRFIALARSNQVRTPRDAMSEIIDERWVGIDFERMYALSGGWQAGRSSADLKRMMEERLWGSITSGSGAMSGRPESSIEGPRSFRFELNCELVVYGSTEPDALVTIEGKPVKLSPDGTFRLQVALPDGIYRFSTTARSADGLEVRNLTPVIQRTTHSAAKEQKLQGGRL